MKETIIGVCESAFGFTPSVMTENAKALSGINPLSEKEKGMFKYTPEKVTVNTTDGMQFFIEYTNNLERLINDKQVSVDEAIESVCEANEILKGSVTIVVDESCVDKVDLGALSEKYDVKRI